MSDFIIPTYCERPEALEATVLACLNQTCEVGKIGKIFVVDDGSPESMYVLPSISDRVDFIRLPENRGISAARNTAIRSSTSEWIACVNVEVLPAPDWLDVNLTYLTHHENVGVTFSRTLPFHPRSVLARWRMRFQEGKVASVSGPAPFAMGHAVLFRREALDAVGGYDEQFRRIAEDGDICTRMREIGWETHFIAKSGCRSIQDDSLRSLAKKELFRGGWIPGEDFSFRTLFGTQTKRFVKRLVRNLGSGRLLFLPIDVAVWGLGFFIAASVKRGNDAT